MFLDVPLAVPTPGLAVTICSLCLSVCRQNNSKKYRQMLMIFYWRSAMCDYQQVIRFRLWSGSRCA